MKKLVILYLSICSTISYGQSIAATNLKYWYAPESKDAFHMAIANEGDFIRIYYELDTARFLLTWEKRESYGQRSGEKLNISLPERSTGTFTLPSPEKPWLLVATLISKSGDEGRYYVRRIESNYPSDRFLMADRNVIFRSAIASGKTFQLSGAGTERLTAYRYTTSFPAASPPFAEKEKSMTPVLTADSSFQLQSGMSFTIEKEGLYLVQADTNGSKALAFRVVDAVFPRYNRIPDLAGPLIYVCTATEYDKIRQAGNDKTKFDKVILEIAGDKEKAKNLMRNYFRRVELANDYFTSYKEGWKTDRGMIFTIFGPPDEVSQTGDNEIWLYKSIKARFIFVRTPTLFDPENFVLLRDKRMAETWYYAIDMWRKDWMGRSR